jgi:hypothetical protein
LSRRHAGGREEIPGPGFKNRGKQKKEKETKIYKKGEINKKPDEN